MLKTPKRIIVCEKDENRIKFVNEHYPNVLTVTPEECLDFILRSSDHGGVDVVLEVAGAENTFELEWKCARPNAIITVVALYDKEQTLPLPDMYGKNLTLKTRGVDGYDCEEMLKLIAEGKLHTKPLITHTYPLRRSTRCISCLKINAMELLRLRLNTLKNIELEELYVCNKKFANY